MNRANQQKQPKFIQQFYWLTSRHNLITVDVVRELYASYIAAVAYSPVKEKII